MNEAKHEPSLVPKRGENGPPGPELLGGKVGSRQPAKRRRRSVVTRVAFYGLLAVAGSVLSIELWARSSYDSSVSRLQDLQNSSDSFPSLDEAEDSLNGWLVRPFGHEDKGTREEITVRWRSVFGDYWVRLYVIRKRDSGEKLFARFVTADDKPWKAIAPAEFTPAPKRGPVGASVDPKRRQSKKRKLLGE